MKNNNNKHKSLYSVTVNKNIIKNISVKEVAVDISKLYEKF